MKKRLDATTDDLFAELTAIKQLIVFALLRSGASQDDVAATLGVDQSKISRMFPIKPPGLMRKKAAGPKKR